MNRPASIRRASGIALVAVLVFVALASAGVLALVDRTAVGVMVEARARRQERLSREAAATLQSAQAMLVEAARELKGLHHPAEGWTRLERPAGRDTVVADVEDASARVSLAMLDEEMAGRLFLSLGESTGTARTAAAAWNTHREAHRAQAGHLAGDWEGLWRLPGFAACVGANDRERTERADRVRDRLALESFDRCNVNTASPEVLRLLGLDESATQRLRAQMIRTLVAPPPGMEAAWGRLAVTAQALVIEVRAEEPGLDICRLRGLLRPGEGGAREPAAASGQKGGEAKRLAGVAEEIRRRRSLRQARGARQGTTAAAPAAPAGGAPEAQNYQLIESQEWFIEPGS